MSTLSTSNICHPEYKESEALQALLETANETLAEANDKYDTDDAYLECSFSINVGGKSIAFLLGGPQLQAICKFVDNIAEENGYEVNHRECTVLE